MTFGWWGFRVRLWKHNWMTWWRFWFFSLGTRDGCRDMALKEGATASFHTLAADNPHNGVYLNF